MNYISPADEIQERQIYEKLFDVNKKQEPKINNTSNDKFFCGGRRKTAHAMAMVSPGRGVVTVNHVPFLEYFHEQDRRTQILYPISVASLACKVDIALFVRGGGISAQVQSCQMALARCLVKRNPMLKSLFKKCKEFFWIFLCGFNGVFFSSVAH